MKACTISYQNQNLNHNRNHNHNITKLNKSTPVLIQYFIDEYLGQCNLTFLTFANTHLDLWDRTGRSLRKLLICNIIVYNILSYQ